VRFILVVRQLPTYKQLLPAGAVLATLNKKVPRGTCGSAVVTMNMAGEEVGSIREGLACTLNWWTISDTEGGPALYRLRHTSYCCGSNMSLTEVRTNKVIGHIKKVDGGGCGPGKHLVIYPQELPLEHKLLLIVNLCTLQRYEDGHRV
jgi:hypothetical protein